MTTMSINQSPLRNPKRVSPNPPRPVGGVGTSAGARRAMGADEGVSFVVYGGELMELGTGDGSGGGGGGRGL